MPTRSVTGETRQKTFARLLGVHLPQPVHRPAGGQALRRDEAKLGLACTLVGRPKVLLLDEPGVGVIRFRHELWQMVHELAGDGMLILWSTSYLDEGGTVPGRAADERRRTAFIRASRRR